MEKLLDSRARYGVQSREGMEPGCPLTAEDTATGEHRVTLTRAEVLGIVEDAIARLTR